MRSIEEITEAEEKYFDLYWLDRHTKGVNPGLVDRMLKEGMLTKEELKPLKEAARVRKIYKGDKDFEFWEYTHDPSFIAGKLSALRWVLGSEWDDLDT